MSGGLVDKTLKEFVELETERRELKDRLKKVKAKQSKLEEELLEKFQESGVQSLNIDGLTVYLRRQLWAYPPSENKEEFYQILKDTGYGDFVRETVNTHSLSALFREAEDNEFSEIPTEIREKVNLSEKFSVRTRSSN